MFFESFTWPPLVPLKSKELTKQEESFHHPGPLFQPLKTLTFVTATADIPPYLWFPHKKSKLFKFLFKGQIPEENNHMRKDGLGEFLLPVLNKNAIKGRVELATFALS